MCGYSFYLNNALKIFSFFALNECVKRLFFHCYTLTPHLLSFSAVCVSLIMSLRIIMLNTSKH